MSKMYKQLKTNDECYTPVYGVSPIVYEVGKYLQRIKPGASNDKLTIWCPFDTDKSEYVKEFKAWGFNVIHSHIVDGKDFLTWEPQEHYDIIVSNPPFTNKRVWVERAISLGKPFAFLLPATWLNDTAPFNLDVQLDILMFDKRISFGRPGISFKAIYFSWGIMSQSNTILPPVFKVVKLNKPKPKDEIKSQMWEDFPGIAKALEVKNKKEL